MMDAVRASALGLPWIVTKIIQLCYHVMTEEHRSLKSITGQSMGAHLEDLILSHDASRRAEG